MGKADEQTPPPLRRRRGNSLPQGRARARISPSAAPPTPPSLATSPAASSHVTNQQVQEAVQQQISLQNGNLLNLMELARNELMQKKDEEIARLQVEIQNTQEALDMWRDILTRTNEMNQMPISELLPPMQGTNAHEHDLTNESESTGSCNQAMNMEGTAAANMRRPTCRLCCSRGASMLILPCQHLCACKYCEVNLTVCPICGTAKANAIEARFG